MKRTRIPHPRFSAIALATFLLSVVLSDEALPFDEESIAGTFAFSASGTIVPITPAVAVGLATFDGAGGCSFRDQINIGGVAMPSTTSFRESDTCTYAVNEDGTGTISVSFPGDPAPIPLTFAIADDATELRFIRPDVGVASGVMKRRTE